MPRTVRRARAIVAAAGKPMNILAVMAAPDRKMVMQELARKPRKRRQQPERALHAHVGRMLAYLKPACVYFPVPNGATDLGKKMGGILLGQYKLFPGVSDWVFLWADHAGCIELKAGAGKQSDRQKIFEGDCKLRGVSYVTCRSVDEVIETLELWKRLPAGTCHMIRGGRIVRHETNVAEA